ncbi:hypothetical protein BTVI_123248 [Pitangus sulphuratus]|nr:hypothetical protein BTVI_123248 [Pitangus sulphuratus]
MESLSYDNLRSLQGDAIRHLNELILTWMTQVWDSTGDAINHDGNEILKSIAQDVGIKEVFVRESKSFSVWA